MDELVSRLAGKLDIERPVAEKAVAMIMAFLLDEGPADKVQMLIDQTPGAQASVDAARAEPAGMMSGLMGLGARLMALGLDVTQIQSIAAAIVAHSRATAGDETTAEIVGAVPGLDGFVAAGGPAS